MLYPIFNLNLGSFPIYQIMLLIALSSAYIVFRLSLKKLPFSDYIKSRIRSAFFWSGLFGALCANLSNWIFYPETNTLSLVDRFAKGGFSFFFGMLCFFGFAALILRIKKVHIKYCINLFVPSLLIFQVFARIGCSLTGCCYGHLLEIGSISFHLPIRELEIIFALVLFFILKKFAYNKRFELYLFSYSAFRFIFDFFRGDKVESILGTTAITPTQIAALITVIVVGIVCFILPLIKKNKSNESSENNTSSQNTKKKYTPLPVNLQKPVNNALKIIAAILFSIIAVICAFIMINPFNMSWCDNLRYYIEDTFSFAFESGSSENTLDGANGLHISDISFAGVLENESEVLKAVVQHEKLTYFDFRLTDKASLPNGSNVYTFTQQIDNKPVYGKNKVVVTKSDNSANYTIGDNSQFTSIKDTAYNPTQNSKTVKEALGEGVKLTKKTDCWYDSGSGLIEAYYAELTKDDKAPILAAIISKKDDKIITFININCHTVSSLESNNIIIALKDIITLIKEQNDAQLDLFSKKPQDTTEYDESYRKLLRALSLYYYKSELSYEQYSNLLETVYEIVSYVPNINMQILIDIMAEETEQMLIQEGYNEDDAISCAKRVSKSFSTSGIKIKGDDSSVITLESGERKSTFRHSIDFANDVDTFRITSEVNTTTSIKIVTDAPVNVSVSDDSGNLLTSIYIEEEESLTFYPEDGNNLTLQISDGNYSAIASSDINDYKITLQSKEEKAEIPGELIKTITKIEDCYASSNAASFLAMTAIDGQQNNIEESVGLGLLAPVLDSCQGCAGLENSVDTAKSLIASIIIPEEYFSKIEITDMYGTDMELTYVQHINTDNGYILKAHVNLSESGYNYYDGYTYLLLENLEDTRDYSEYSEQEVSTLNLMTFIFGNDYSITQSNTKELYSAFGDKDPTSQAQSDIDSLYDLITNETVDINGIPVPQISLDETIAIKAGHSEEKIVSFKKYVLNKNISNAKQTAAMLRLQKDMCDVIAEGIPTVKLIIDFVTNPVATCCDILFDDSKIWYAANLIMDFPGTITDTLVDEVINEVINSMKEESAKLQEGINSVEALITEHTNALSELNNDNKKLLKLPLKRPYQNYIAA